MSELKKAVETQHGGAASFIESVPVIETFDDKIVGQGLVQVVALSGHSSAARCLRMVSAGRAEPDRFSVGGQSRPNNLSGIQGLQGVHGGRRGVRRCRSCSRDDPVAS